jgi:hypothetical protein
MLHRVGRAIQDETRTRVSSSLSRYTNGSDWSQVAWIVPLSEGAEVIAWALVLCPIDGDIDPFVSDVYESVAAAIKALELEGALRQSLTGPQ